MEALSITKKQDRLPLFMAVAAAGMLLFYLFIPVAPLRWHDLYLSYGKTAIVAMAAVYFYCRGFSGTMEIKLVLYYTIWFSSAVCSTTTSICKMSWTSPSAVCSAV